ncbi:MAG: chemotaxis protein CheW, partial [Xenococcaceae cyanobacterium MO_167.B52]|nr:chemotaxis protein CheW [Xenococcaceae cyanobacterium MO_167.B52]
NNQNAQIMVIEVDDIKAGIIVDAIFDVLYLDGEKLSSAPTAVASKAKNYVLGTAFYEDTMLTRIDLIKMLAEDRLVVK